MQSVQQGRKIRKRRASGIFQTVDLSEPSMAPIIAGARARGVADAFECLGLATILLGPDGSALHVNVLATRLLGAEVEIVGGHLVGRDPAANRTLQNLISATLCGDAQSGKEASAILPRQGGLGPLYVHAFHLPGVGDDQFQLLKAVLVLGDSRSVFLSEAIQARTSRTFGSDA